MSRKTIQALRSFTTKLAVEAAMPASRKPVDQLNIEETMQHMKENPLSNIDELNAPTHSRVGPAAELYREPTLMERLQSGANSALQYLPSGASMGAIGGGAALGGLGAYGLAQLMRSRKDEEESSFPWLSTLAGTAGGGALAAYLMSRAGQQAPAAPAQAPAATPAALNTTPVPAGSQPTIA